MEFSLFFTFLFFGGTSAVTGQGVHDHIQNMAILDRIAFKNPLLPEARDLFLFHVAASLFPQNGFPAGIVAVSKKVNRQLLRRRRKSDEANAPAVPPAAGPGKHIGKQEDSAAGQLIQPGMQLGEPVVFCSRDAIGHQPDQQDGTHGIPDFSRQPPAQHRKKPE